MEKQVFQFEKLTVWQRAIEFCVSVINSLEKIDSQRHHYRLIEQMESCCASIAANIAEGKGRYSKKEFINFLYISRGSLYEAITFLMIFYKKGWLKEENYNQLKGQGEEVSKMLSGLITYMRGTTYPKKLI